MNLECINCGAVYLDKWDVTKCPICPTCHVSHYVDSEESAIRPATRRFSSPGLSPPLSMESWLPFYALQILSDKVPEIDQEIAFTVGMLLCKMPIDRIRWSLVIRNLVVSSDRKRHHEVYSLNAGFDAASHEDLEFDVVLRDYINMLSLKWNADASKRKYNPTLTDAANAVWPGDDSSDEEKRMYKAVREQLRVFRRSLEIG
jgi:predicted  nucleic acid-binding Zn-ribbon protein